MTDLKTANFFRDRGVQDDPYTYFDAVRAQSPVWQEPHFGVFMVASYDEALGWLSVDVTSESLETTVLLGSALRLLRIDPV